MIDLVYRYCWGPRFRFGSLRVLDRKGQLCRVITRGAMNSALVEFEDGARFVISRNALRRAIRAGKPGGCNKKMRPRVVWTWTRRGFIARTQGGETTVECLNRRQYWEIRVNGKQRRIAPSLKSAKRYGRDFL